MAGGNCSSILRHRVSAFTLPTLPDASLAPLVCRHHPSLIRDVTSLPRQVFLPSNSCLWSTMPKAVLLLILWALLGNLPAAEGRTSPYAVKLCGREFIRAVIFTCGGSRWRRDRAGKAFAEELGDESQETTSIEWLSSPLVPLSREPEDFYSSVRGSNWSGMSRSRPELEPEAKPGQGFLRGGRDVLAGVSSNCCKWGCSKTEISSLC
ncbi:relaxin-3 isoform X1 [Sarcophilus harrisii]|uniref:Relaxin-3 n=2 Tax=Sarcophilus harrisii TaxID=9305 RepID=A0A7N4V736_SARHA|nr:relaxin-3 isoform X1 [Sarcophilus harrisii]